MKKYIFIIFAATMTAAIIATLFVGCQKEKDLVDPDGPLHNALHPNYHNLSVPYHSCSILCNAFSDNGYYYFVHYAHVIYCNIAWSGPNPS